MILPRMVKFSRARSTAALSHSTPIKNVSLILRKQFKLPRAMSLLILTESKAPALKDSPPRPINKKVPEAMSPGIFFVQTTFDKYYIVCTVNKVELCKPLCTRRVNSRLQYNGLRCSRSLRFARVESRPPCPGVARMGEDGSAIFFCKKMANEDVSLLIKDRVV